MQDGFAVIIQEVRGRGESEGEFRAHQLDAEDGADTIAWIRRQSWSDGRVGMVGASYNWLLQFQAAQQRPEGLLAIAPSAMGALRPVCFPGGAPRLSLLGGWWLSTLLSAALDNASTEDERSAIAELLDASALERLHAFVQRDSTCATSRTRSRSCTSAGWSSRTAGGRNRAAGRIGRRAVSYTSD